MRSPSWIALMSGIGLIALSTSTFAATSPQAVAPAESKGVEVADNQQQFPPPNGQKTNQTRSQQHGNQQRGQQFQQQPKTHTQPKIYAQPQGQQYQRQPKTYVQPKVYAQPQGEQYQRQQQPKAYVQQRTSAQPQSRRYDWNAYQPGHRPPQWEQFHQNFDPRPYEANRYAEHRYHWEAYREPRGWYYRRWSYGEVFPVAFWTQEYWIVSYWQFGLLNPPYGYVWVRYGPDALLVDVENGQILGVVYAVFA